jgi:hypothetical protein
LFLVSFTGAYFCAVPSKKVAIVQSNYIPWKGYFDIINSVDEFILFDDVQYTRRDWRNRNLIKTANGLLWLTIPVEVKDKFDIPINQVTVAEPNWAKKHWTTLSQAYAKAPFFREYRPVFENLYLTMRETHLSRINYRFIQAINELLGIPTRITWSTDYGLTSGKNEKLASLCAQAGATEYLSGPAAKDYLDEAYFAAQGISVAWMDYSGYPEYGQLYPPFAHGVSVLDLLFTEGPRAKHFMKSFRQPVA